MYYTIYQTINLVNGKRYIGMHQTDNLDDDYLGSGIRLQNAIMHYGRENFKKELLFVFETLEEMVAKERELVTEEVVNSSQYYNMMIGGKGGRQSKEAIEKIRAKSKEYWANMTEEDKKLRSNQISNGCDRNRRRELILGEKNPMFNKKHSEETRQKLCKNSAKRDYTLLEWRHSDGRVFVGTMLEFYTENNLCRAWVSRVRRGIKQSIKGWHFVREL
jgi:group I intron endonuclease